MPQEFHVLQCYNCSTFQVHQVKKSSNKWNCKICGEKQSIKKIFGKGSGADCRNHVQKLNILRQEHDELQMLSVCHNGDCEKERGEPGSTPTHHNTFSENHTRLDTNCDNSVSKWNQYVEEAPVDAADEAQHPDDDLYTTDGTVFNTSRKRKRNNGSSNKKGMKHQYDWETRQSVPSAHDENVRLSPINNSGSLFNCAQNFNQPQACSFQVNTSQTKQKSSWQTSPHEEVSSLISNEEQYNVLKSINQKSFLNSPVTTDPIKSKKIGHIQANAASDKMKGSKWDLYVEDEEEDEEEEEEVSYRDSREDQENVRLVSKQPVALNLQHNRIVHLPKARKIINPGLFCIGELDDSDLDI